MSKSRKVILSVIGGTVGLSILAIIGLMVFVDTTRFKAQMETAASNMLDMEVVFGGQMKVNLFRGLHVTFDDVHLRNHAADVATATKLTLGIELWPLLRGDIRFNEILLAEPTITIARDSQGKFNIERSKSSPGGLPRLTVLHVSLTDATLVYVDKQSDQDFLANNCRVDVYDLHITADKGTQESNIPNDNPNTDLSNSLTFSTELECGEIRADSYRVFDLKLAADKEKTDLNLMPITVEVLGAQGSGSILVDFAAGAPQYQVQFSLPQFNIASFFDTLAQEQATEQPALGAGTMDFSARLSMQGKTIKEITRSANGNFSLRGENLSLNGTDLDSQFEKFESSQHFSLVDVGAFFYAGPLGLVLTKGYDFTGILRGSGGQSEISSLVSEWKVEGGVAKAVDVAMATTKNRIALHGNLDFVNGRYNEVTVALIDGDGCAVVKQEIHGNFLKPAVEQPNILKSLAGPVISLLEKGRDLFPGDECEVFYVGSVAHPK